MTGALEKDAVSLLGDAGLRDWPARFQRSLGTRDEPVALDMAEEQRYVSSHSEPLSQGRGNENAGGSSGDPLAELARLMGQDQRLARPARKGAERSPTGAVEVPNWLSRPAKPAAEANGEAASVELPPAPDLGSWRGRFADLESVLGRSLAISPEVEPGPPNGAGTPRVAADLYGDHQPSRSQSVATEDQTREEGSDPYRTADYDGRYEADQETPTPADQSYYAEDATPRHSDQQSIAAPDEETAYDPPATWRHLSLQRGILALIGLVVVGSVAAYGYRSLTGHGSGVPPIIKASTEPAKVMASAQGSDSQSGKQIYDRLDNPRGQSQTETMMPRQEEPMSLPTRPAEPAQAPAGAASSTAAASLAPAVAALPPLVGGTPTNGEPKKVRTVTIRADQPPPAAATAQELAGMAATVQPTAQPWPAPAPTAPAGASAFPPPPAAAPASTAAAPPAHLARPARKPRTAANEPMAIGPQAEASAAAEPVPAGPATRSMPTRLAALPAAAEGGHYAVQVSSQRSEAEAHSSFRAMQQKYPSVLGGREPLIRRADLGSKGIYYRAQVGPFPTLEEANRMCGALKAAGGQCIIQHD